MIMFDSWLHPCVIQLCVNVCMCACTPRASLRAKKRGTGDEASVCVCYMCVQLLGHLTLGIEMSCYTGINSYGQGRDLMMKPCPGGGGAFDFKSPPCPTSSCPGGGRGLILIGASGY